MKMIFDADLHKRYLTTLLIEITKKFLSKIGFKGGTCAYFFYDLPRFSYDLDFDILKPFSDVDIDSIKEILSKHGDIKDFQDKKFTLFAEFDYGKYYPNIKIELNKRVWLHNKYTEKLFLGVPILISDESTLLTNKMVALVERTSPVARDLFDVNCFLKNGFNINENLIRERTGKDIITFLTYLLGFIKKTYTTKNVLQGLGEILENKQKNWVKRNLILDTISEIQKKLNDLKK